MELGSGEILLTSMDEDGQKQGYDLELTRAVSQATPVPVIASGGAGNLDHLYDALDAGQADAVLAASIFHFGEYSIGEAKDYLGQREVCRSGHAHKGVPPFPLLREPGKFIGLQKSPVPPGEG